MPHLIALAKTVARVVTVTNASTAVLAANDSRTYLRLTNLGGEALYLNFGAAAAGSQGLVLAPLGAASGASNNAIWDSAECGVLPTGAVYAMGVAGTQSLAILSDI